VSFVSNSNSPCYVDKSWYLQQYPDVAAAEMDPVEHYLNHGRYEGRLPCSLPAMALERDLWANAFNPEKWLTLLESQVKSNDANSIYAGKVLASFYLFQSKFDQALHHALQLLAKLNTSSLIIDPSTIFLLGFEAAYRSGNMNKAKELVNNSNWTKSNSKLLSLQMLDSKRGNLKHINEIYKKSKLLKVACANGVVSLDTLFSIPSKLNLNVFRKPLSSPVVSVVVPVFNSASTLQTAIDSLLNQTWKSIEIVIVDDCSTDDFSEVIQRYIDIPNLQVITNEKNIGAYATRNKGVKVATGELVTVMDADDWAHPQKIEKQALPLLRNADLVGSISHWVRCNDKLQFTQLKTEITWIHRNISSLMVRRKVFDIVGYWDELRANADTEFYLRLLASFGDKSLEEVCPEVPLSFGRVHDGSITKVSKTHLATQFGGARKEHIDFSRVWHLNANKPLHLPSTKREFPVPAELSMSGVLSHKELSELSRWRRAFNNQWYLKSYQNVDIMGLTLHQHFWSFGELADYSPSPFFIPSAYRFKHQLRGGISPTWEALRRGWSFDDCIVLDGEAVNHGKCIAVFSHSVSEHVFGAEISFIDMVKACFNSGYRIFLYLPNAVNAEYVNTLLKFVEKITFVPLLWFYKGRAVEPQIVTYLSNSFSQNHVELVYVNTIMLLEPYLAASDISINTLTHVRELPEHDSHLRSVLKETATESRTRLLENSSYFVANSCLTASWLDAGDRTAVVYNRVNSPGNTEPVQITAPLKVCMISSNTLKKGIDDFFHIAKQCEHTEIEFNLYGPVTEEVKRAIATSEPRNIKVHGYIQEVSSALSRNDVVLCLSNFKESFGRTAAEAMSCGRVVVGYDWGAINEVVDPASGILVPFKKSDLVVAHLLNFSVDKSKLLFYGSNARKRANEMFSESVYSQAMKKVLEKIISDS
tara:strand:- start:2575 stop:5364 length:2790 start_codon:yes stop_codon:yes gene_type:complete